MTPVPRDDVAPVLARDGERCPEGGLTHPIGECPWCDQKRADDYRDASIRQIREAREAERRG